MKIEISTTLPDHILVLLTFKGFFEHYEKLWESGLTQSQAFKATDSLHYEYFKHHKYSCFNSFRNIAARNK